MVEPQGLQVQGLCRFSFPCTGGFKKYHESLAERRAALYAPARLDQRLMWFEEVGLPGLAAQTDRDFVLHMLVGEDLPQPWRDRLEGVVRDTSQIRLHFLPPIDHRAACRQVLHGGRDATRAHVAEFRLDDDDAVAVNYVSALRSMHRKVARLAGANGRVALDHGRGIVLRAAPDGTVAMHPLFTHCWSAGLAVYLKVADEAIVMDFPHHRIWMRMPFVNVTEQFMFIRGDHATNDARTPWATAGEAPHDPDALPDLLRQRFGIDFARFADRWKTVAKG